MPNNIMPGEYDWMSQLPGPANAGMGMQPQAPKAPGLLDRIGGAMFGGQQSYGGLLGPQEQQAAKRQAMMAMASQLMAAGGPSATRTSFGQALGPALMAGQQAQQSAGKDMLEAMLLKTKLQTAGQTTGQKDYQYAVANGYKGTFEEWKRTGTKASSGVQEYEYAKANGYQGSFEDWKRVASAQAQAPAGIQEYEYFQKLSPEQQRQFLSLQRSPVVPQVVTVNGVPTLVDRTTGASNPLSTQQSEIAAESAKQFEAALAKARGTATGELAGAVQKKGQSASVVQGMLSMADPLIEVATGSQTGAAADKVAGWFGASLDGAKATAQLRVLQASLMTNMPRMEGPQSDADVLLYRQAAGEIGDPTVPRGLKKAALRTIQALQGRYAEQAADVPAAGLEAMTQPTAPATRPPLSSFQKK